MPSLIPLVALLAGCGSPPEPGSLGYYCNPGGTCAGALVCRTKPQAIITNRFVEEPAQTYVCDLP